ncbi:MAG: lipoprotein [Pseudolabrys sp.]
MNTFGRLSLRAALIAALAATLGLTACGRKGPLDPPPSSSVATQPGAAEAAGNKDEDSQEPGGSNLRAPKKRIPLDVLLN